MLLNLLNSAIRLRRAEKLLSNLSLYVGAASTSEYSSFEIPRNIEETQNTKKLQQLPICLFQEDHHGRAIRRISKSGKQLSDSSFKQLLYLKGLNKLNQTKSKRLFKKSLMKSKRKMSVDRSYNPYETIRAYHNRDMLLGNSQRLKILLKKKNDKIIQSLPHHLVFHLFNQSFSNQIQIKVKYQTKDKLTDFFGFISELINNQVRIKSIS